MHPEKSQLFTTVILTGSRWKCLDMACASFHLFSNKVWTWVQSEPREGDGSWAPVPGLDTSIVGEAGVRYRILRIPREGERFSRFLKKETCPHVLLLLQTRLRSENGARSKGGKKGGDISSLTSVLNISYPSRGLSTTTVWFLTVTEIESYGRCAIRRCFRTFHIA